MSELRRDYEKKINKKLIIIIWIMAIVLNAGYFLFTKIPEWIIKEETVLDQVERNDVEVVGEVIEQIKEDQPETRSFAIEKVFESQDEVAEIWNVVFTLLVMGFVVVVIGSIINALNSLK